LAAVAMTAKYLIFLGNVRELGGGDFGSPSIHYFRCAIISLSVLVLSGLFKRYCTISSIASAWCASSAGNTRRVPARSVTPASMHPTLVSTPCGIS